MADDAIVFALANPDPEIMPEGVGNAHHIGFIILHFADIRLFHGDSFRADQYPGPCTSISGRTASISTKPTRWSIRSR